ncbi:sulfide/dihydroorotate dehydrogenase-like FAD/NAD-binding protein [Candidatus Bathyarchaeota archaeon]|nr:sulfide/dihydroorotate dehydrogenase-like FAD/NAD-binding protein [Candidatus Bathyarchaeota archaeon]
MEEGQIIKKVELAPRIKEIEVYAPKIARRVRAGQFVILIVDNMGERIPLTVTDWDRDRETITIVFQEVGVSTYKLGRLNVGDALAHIVGPLGNPSEIGHFGKVICVSGGVGASAIYPIAREMKNVGNHVVSIIGARSKELLIYEEKMRSVSDDLRITTDDGSKGREGFVTDELRDLINSGIRVNRVIAVGPVIMMKACAEVTRGYKIKTIASLNPVMVCGMGMCGSCRVEVEGETRFVCFEGPEFDAHKVNFDGLLMRLNAYRVEEQIALKRYIENH